jgi:RNA 3'-terminal phosphate cyclase
MDHHDRTDFASRAGAGAMGLFEEGLRKHRIGGIGNHGHPPCGGQQIAGQLDTFAESFSAHLRQAGDVRAGPGQALDQTRPERIARQDHDRDFARGLLRSQGG